ncbi:hypothetical protein VKT23_020409 [Stygiomarasmius scandens]|uniref:Uncharacterized protein n=1 Tax=Marasmiellus scandens TaxID=2682957 RepID=A0ABR1IKX2_9AGAR
MSVRRRCSLQRQFDAFVLVTPVLDTLVSDTLVSDTLVSDTLVSTLVLDTPALVPFHANPFANPLLSLSIFPVPSSTSHLELL